ncbi:MAG: ATP-binding protein [Candidatus Omnitrophota bacterium]|nr:MAG: ATP-binding protein [Candidatus Omnitrophota bacterium]
MVGELISNAIKYMPENETVNVTLTQNNDQIALSV